MSGVLSINDVISRELGYVVSSTDYTIKCPRVGHRDRTPSCRVYPNSEERDNLVGSLYCWGCGFAANPISLIKEVKGFGGWRETFEYIRDVYKVVFGEREYEFREDSLIASVNFLKYYKGYVVGHIDEVSRAIAMSKNGETSMGLRGMVAELLKGGI